LIFPAFVRSYTRNLLRIAQIRNNTLFEEVTDLTVISLVPPFEVFCSKQPVVLHIDFHVTACNGSYLYVCLGLVDMLRINGSVCFQGVEMVGEKAWNL
jgi:hypothetical protein